MREENTGSNETLGPQAHLIGMGKDEMNLAEFPLTTLANRVPHGCKTLVFEDCIFDKGRRQPVTRRLTISASDKYGLPTALDDEVILGLVQLSKADDFASRQVQFSRYQLVHLLGWREEGKSYARLEESLKRWLGVTLYYENAWWDKCRKKWVDAHFHLLDNLILYHRAKRGERSARDDEGKPLSSFIWNEIIFRSFQAGYIRKLDLQFYHTLKSAVAKRMYRFLDKKFYFGHEKRYSLAQFAREHVGLSRNYDAAQLKRRLNPAIKELEETGYLKPLLAEERFARVRRGEWEVLFVRAAKPLRTSAGLRQPAGLEARLIDRGVTASSAGRLVRDYPAESIEAKLRVFDQLAGRRDARISKNPAGFLVKSIQENYLPPAGLVPKACSSSFGAAIGGGHAAETRLRREPPGSYPSESEQKIDQYLAFLPADERSRLVQIAVASARGIPAEGLRRSVASGNEVVAEQYRLVIVRQHVERLLCQAAASQLSG
jgi:hypothetical protein